MGETITLERTIEAYVGIDEARFLTEVDHLNRHRLSDGSHNPKAVEGVRENLVPATKEAAMPYAVSTTYQEYKDGDFWWMIDQSSVDVARSGILFHSHSAAIERVGVEIEEAKDVAENLPPGKIKVVISPKMTRYDATYEEAKDEHLADDDMIRIHMLDIDDDGNVIGKYMQSVLVRDIPLSAWQKMLEDPNNIFSKSIELEEKESALSVMKAHKEMTLPEEKLPEGVITVVESVLPYLDNETRKRVEAQLVLFRSNQAEFHQTAGIVARQWTDFEKALADSLRDEYATKEVETFIRQLSHQWSDEFIAKLSAHTDQDGRIEIDRSLAIDIEEARRNTLWVSAAVVTGNEKILAKVDNKLSQRIYDNTKLIEMMILNGYSRNEIMAVQAENNQIIAGINISVGGGCPGESRGSFADQDGIKLFRDDGKEQKDWKWKDGVCVVGGCPSRPHATKVGPCSVCRGCQNIYDQGGNPVKNYKNIQTIGKIGKSLVKG
jgi:hypothetical protein